MKKIITILLLSILYIASCEDNTILNVDNRPATTLDFSIPVKANVTIKIYALYEVNDESVDNIQIGGGTYLLPEGLNFIFTLSGTYEAGHHTFEWNFQDSNGIDVLGGWYRIFVNIDNSTYSTFKDVFIQR